MGTSSPGMRYRTPGSGRESESADRRGMRRDSKLPFLDATLMACPSNGLAFSCGQGARHGITFKKPRSRAPKAVSCNAMFGAGRRLIYGQEPSHIVVGIAALMALTSFSSAVTNGQAS